MAKSKLGYGHGTGIPNPVDVHVGARLRQRRTPGRVFDVETDTAGGGGVAEGGAWTWGAGSLMLWRGLFLTAGEENHCKMP